MRIYAEFLIFVKTLHKKQTDKMMKILIKVMFTPRSRNSRAVIYFCKNVSLMMLWIQARKVTWLLTEPKRFCMSNNRVYVLPKQHSKYRAIAENKLKIDSTSFKLCQL